MAADLKPVDVRDLVRAACPACGGPGCEKCLHTGQAEFCGAEYPGDTEGQQ